MGPSRLGSLQQWFAGFLAAFGEREVPMRAVALAYYAFFSLFPLALLAVSVLGYLVNVDAPLAEDLQARVIRGLTRTLAVAGQSVSDGVADAFETLGASATGIGVVGLVGLLWGLSGSLNAIASAIGRIFDPKAPLPGWKERLKSGRVILGIGGLFVLLNLVGLSLPLLPFGEELKSAYRLVVQAVGPVLTFAILYRFLPTEPPRWREALLGALVGGLLFAGLQFGFSYYLRFVSYENTFGRALAGIAVLFVWLNFSSLTFLLGALVAARLRPEDRVPATQAEAAHGAGPAPQGAAGS